MIKYILIFLPVLTIAAIITLKLISYIDWSWWWILSPIYVPLLWGFLGAWASISEDNNGRRQ